MQIELQSELDDRTVILCMFKDFITHVNKKDEICKDNCFFMAQCEGELILRGEKCLKPIIFAVNQCDMLLRDVSWT